jgi:hypothetical protein
VTDTSLYVGELARHLLAHEIGDGTEVKGLPSVQVVAAGERIFHRLHEQLAQWFGSDGYEALFARALERTRRSHPVLDTVTRYSPGTNYLESIDAHALAASPEIVADGIVALVHDAPHLTGSARGRRHGLAPHESEHES